MKPKSGKCICGRITKRCLGSVAHWVETKNKNWRKADEAWAWQCAECSKKESWIGLRPVKKGKR